MPRSQRNGNTIDATFTVVADTGDSADTHICRCRHSGVDGAHDEAGTDDTTWRLGCSGYGSYVAEGWNDQYEAVMACEASW